MEKQLISFIQSQTDPKLMPPLVWAYVGDAVFEIFVRCHLAASGHKVQELHKQAVKSVKAQAQADILADLEGELTPEEKDIVRRGRNAKSSVPKNADMVAYRYSTGFEAMIGYLYLSGSTDRLWELLSKIDPTKR